LNSGIRGQQIWIGTGGRVEEKKRFRERREIGALA